MNAKQELEDAVQTGRMAFKAWRPGDPRPVVRHNWVEEHLGGKAFRGVQIRGARIEGMLDLKDARAHSGEACCALILEDCVLEGDLGADGSHPGIDARHGHLERLSLVNCKTAGIELSSAIIVGDLTLDGLGALQLGEAGARDEGARSEAGDRQRACWVKARGIRVGGELTAREANLDLPWPRGAGPSPDHEFWKDIAKPFGLDLTGARIDGSLVLQPDFVAGHGVRLQLATIGGALWAQGAVLEGDLSAALIEVRGPAVFDCDEDRRFDADGILDFSGARIGGDLRLSGARVGGGDDGSGALLLTSASLEADVWLVRDGEVSIDIPTMNLITATVGGDLFIEASDVPIQRIGGGELKVAGKLSLSGLVSNTDLEGTIIGGDVEIGGTGKAPINSVHAAGLRAHRSLRLSGNVAGTCDFTGSVIDGDVELGIEGNQDRGIEDDPLILNATWLGRQPKLVFTRASVGGALRVAPKFTVAPPTEKLAIRTAGLSCYPGWRLVEASISSDDERTVELLAYLYRPDHKPSIVILNGKSDPIHRLNEVQPPVLGNEHQVKQYLSLFCTYVWGEEGAFEIDNIRDLRRPDDADVVAAVEEIGREPEAGSWKAVAKVEYGKGVFNATFLLEPSGSVSMINDEPIGTRPEGPVHYDSPVRRVRVEGVDPRSRTWPIPLPREVDFILGGDVPEWEMVQEARRRNIEGQPDASIDLQKTRPSIDLEGLRVGSLSDGAGKHWFGPALDEEESRGASARLWLRLGGFEYGRIDRPPPEQEHSEDAPRRLRSGGEAEQARGQAGDDSLEYRRRWLRAQYKNDLPTRREYRPQPYEQLAKIWRAEGRFKEADDITLDRLWIEKTKLSAPSRIWYKAAWHTLRQWLAHPIGWWFGFGLRPWHATATFAVFWAIGVLLIFVASGTGALKVDPSAVNTVVTGEGRIVVEAGGAGLAEIECGNQINEVIYPLDVMIPIVDLRQEPRCHFSFDEWVPNFLQGLYSVVGWLILTGFIITWSGVVRRHTQG